MKIKNSGSFASILTFGIVSLSAQAAPFEMVSDSCKGFRGENRRWVAEPSLPIPKGARLEADPVAGRSDQVIAKWDGVYFALPVRCLQPIVGAVGTSEVPTAGAAGGAGVLPSVKNVAAFARGKQPPARVASFLRVETGLLSWQETASLGDAAESVDLRAASFGAFLGVGYQRMLSRRFEWHALGAFVFGSSELGNSTATSSSSLQYLVSGATTLGGLVEGSFLWMPSDPDVALGIGLPVLFRSASWVEPSGYRLTSTFAVEPGAFIEGRMTRGSWIIFSRFGLLSGLGNIAWSLSAAYQW